MQVLADLQRAVANLRAYLGLAPVASTLPSFPHGAKGSLSAPSPPSPHAEAERKDREVLGPSPIKEAADQQGEVALMEPSTDDATLMADKRAMEQKATVEAHRATPTVETPSWVKSLCVVIPAEDGGGERRVLGSRSKGSPVAPVASEGDDGVFEGRRRSGPGRGVGGFEGVVRGVGGFRGGRRCLQRAATEGARAGR
ncbi:hypothetical protein GUJ93_ZPchr0013g37816 [Zizania palustris]|uniref:Uncharacterized protein n=1 Tax=Zizania palustris TaxID=103762 RepID=A0A8J5X770_ZIZPA|nr:hypothetical protein GUJ93_ZPchr0013g37816 [Zizania palustris]